MKDKIAALQEKSEESKSKLNVIKTDLIESIAEFAPELVNKWISGFVKQYAAVIESTPADQLSKFKSATKEFSASLPGKVRSQLGVKEKWPHEVDSEISFTQSKMYFDGIGRLPDKMDSSFRRVYSGFGSLVATSFPGKHFDLAVWEYKGKAGNYSPGLSGGYAFQFDYPDTAKELMKAYAQELSLFSRITYEISDLSRKVSEQAAKNIWDSI